MFTIAKTALEKLLQNAKSRARFAVAFALSSTIVFKVKALQERVTAATRNEQTKEYYNRMTIESQDGEANRFHVIPDEKFIEALAKIGDIKGELSVKFTHEEQTDRNGAKTYNHTVVWASLDGNQIYTVGNAKPTMTVEDAEKALKAANIPYRGFSDAEIIAEALKLQTANA